MRISRELLVRSASGIVLVTILLCSILLSEISLYIVLSLIGLVSLYEYLSIVGRRDIKVIPSYTLSTTAILLATLYIFPIDEYPIIIICVALVIIFIRFAMELYRKDCGAITAPAAELLGIIYTVTPMYLLSMLSGKVIVAFFVMVWFNDIFAYLAGVTFGKHKLFERHSPKKSWEGFIGGFVFTIISAYLIGKFCLDGEFEWIIIGAVVSITAVYGDLFESMIKRWAGVKDSANTIPGHGGFMDRFDAVLFAAPFFYIIYEILI